MRNICAWCGMELSGDPEDPDRPVSHGICTPCVDRLLSEEGVPLKDFVASLGIPVLLVTEEGRVQGVSASGAEVAGKTAERIEGQLTGDVFECSNAVLPGGCGRTIHCSGCAIRRTLTDTYETGRGHVRVPATLNVRREEGTDDVALYVTTERVGDRVLLKIEPS